MDRALGIGEKEGWSRGTPGTARRGKGEDEGDTSKRGVRGGWLQAPAWSSSFSSTLSSSSSSSSLPLADWQASSFFLLFPIIDKTETAQYRDTVLRRRVGISVLSLDYSSHDIYHYYCRRTAPLSLPINVTSASSFFLYSPLLSTPLSSGLLAR